MPRWLIARFDSAEEVKRRLALESSTALHNLACAPKCNMQGARSEDGTINTDATNHEIAAHFKLKTHFFHITLLDQREQCWR